MWIICKYITKNGVRIYPKNARFFRFWVADQDDKINPRTHRRDQA